MHSHILHTDSNIAIMKTTLITAIALCAAAATAAPEAFTSGWNKGKWAWGKNNACKDDPLYFAKGAVDFTSTYKVVAYPDQVVNGTTPTGGLAVSTPPGGYIALYHTNQTQGAKATYNLGLDSINNIICWDIELTGFRGEYQSPALTATHIHEAARGASGSPRIAFPNPVGSGDLRVSTGCMKGPFKTGTNGTNRVDNGATFQVSQIEANPAGFFCDVHSSLAVPGAVRGQIA